MKVIRSNEGKIQQGTTFTNRTTLNRLMPAQSEGGISLSLPVDVYFSSSQKLLDQPSMENHL